MATSITFFKVCNGDMTLIKLGDVDRTTLVIDVNIRQDADDPNGDKPDVAKHLRDRIQKDVNGRPYVDAFLLSHPDADHCRGLEKHFYLGPPNDYPDDNKPQKEKRIIIREMWSSPIVFRRQSKTHVLCSDAEAWAKEARRRVALNKSGGFVVGNGDRIQIMGKDVNGKTDNLGLIRRDVDSTFSTINGMESAWFKAKLLGPFDPQSDEEEEELLAKNQSSVIINFTLAADVNNPDGAKFLSGGDAEVYIWSKQWERHSHEPEALEYDLLQTPHHSSWHSLSYDSWSEKGESAVVDKGAKNALSQARSGATIVSSSKPIVDDDIDPPCIRAKREYLSIVNGVNGKFLCTGEHPSKKDEDPIEYTVGYGGITETPRKSSSASIGATAGGFASAAATPIHHG
jgi:beta-lactamase superfamily II metal-dependent hydrolase